MAVCEHSGGVKIMQALAQQSKLEVLVYKWQANRVAENSYAQPCARSSKHRGCQIDSDYCVALFGEPGACETGPAAHIQNTLLCGRKIRTQ